MRMEVSKSMFRDEFQRCGRGEQFSYEGLGALYLHLEEVDSDYELDVVALCCDFVEYPDLDAVAEDCPELADVAADYDGDDEREEAIREWLSERTLLLEFDGGVIIQSF